MAHDGKPQKDAKEEVRILILGVGVGSGHMRAARALEEALRATDPRTPVKVCDLLHEGFPPYSWFYRSVYLFLARRLPRLLDLLYDKSDGMPLGLSRLLPLWDGFFFRKTLSLVRRANADLILCTHFLPLEILAPLRRSGRLSAPLWGIVTDLHPHGIWLWSGVDRYFAADPEQREPFFRRLPETPVSAFGIPVGEEFSGGEPRDRLLRRLGLPDRKTVLLLSGGAGVVDLPRCLLSLSELSAPLNVVAIAGDNPALLESCRRAVSRQEGPILFRVLGFVTNMAEWMSLADLVVTKPGGLTLFEALALGRPLLLLPARGGQEAINRQWAVTRGAAVACDSEEAAGPLVKSLLENPARLKSLGEASKQNGCPGAARMVAREALEALPDCKTPNRRFS
ncbi:MAG: MGDG synthase family glycosyltransferase [Leptospirales bacterium]